MIRRAGGVSIVAAHQSAVKHRHAGCFEVGNGALRLKRGRDRGGEGKGIQGGRKSMLLEVREGVFVDLREVLGIFDPRTASLPAGDALEASPEGGPGPAALVLTDRGVVAAGFDPPRLAQRAQALAVRARLRPSGE
jgi:hypothetical protein